VKHVDGSSLHRPGTVPSWKAYWEGNTGEKFPTACPGNINTLTKTSPHVLESGQQGVGCHVLIRDKHGNEKYAIVPACSGCNRTNPKDNIQWLCRAVTIADPSTNSFAGRINLSPDSTQYWIRIYSISAEFNQFVEGGIAVLEVTGLTNKREEVVKVYADPGTYLVHLLSMTKSTWRDGGPSTTNPGGSSVPGGNFNPQVITCNARRYPMRAREDYRRRCGVCEVDGLFGECHRQSNKPSDRCKAHSPARNCLRQILRVGGGGGALLLFTQRKKPWAHKALTGLGKLLVAVDLAINKVIELAYLSE